MREHIKCKLTMQKNKSLLSQKPNTSSICIPNQLSAQLEMYMGLKLISQRYCFWYVEKNKGTKIEYL